MEKYLLFKRKDVGSAPKTLVCVKQVKQESPEEWDESMPLPGDIIEGFAEADGRNDDDDDEMLFSSANSRYEFSSQLGKISQQVEAIWVKVRRGGVDNILKLRARVVPEKCSMLRHCRKFTITAATDDRHVAILADLTFEQCTELQEKSRNVVSTDCRGFNRRGMKYDWKTKVGTYLPDHRSTVVSSVLFSPLQCEYSVDSTIVRCMAWFTAAVSSGAPLVFVNIQTEQMLTTEKDGSTGKEVRWVKQPNQPTSVEIKQGVRLWFLPGVSEVLIEVTPEPKETRFGMDIKRTDEGLIYIYSVTKGSAADRAGLVYLHEEAKATGHLLVISRLQGKSVMPSSVDSSGLIDCCDHFEIRDTITCAIERMDGIQLHIMAWPNQTRTVTTQPIGVATLRPPKP